MNRITTKTLLFLLIMFLSAASVFAQDDSVLYRIILIGDAGELKNEKNNVVDAVKKKFNLSNNKTTIVFLGDNIYPYGMPDEESTSYIEAKEIISYQASLGIQSNAKIVFIPGNHDWDKGRPDGLERIQREQHFVDSLNASNIQFLPKDGCPGPEEIVLNDDLVLVVMDSQWWLHPYDKPGISSDCDCKTKDEIQTKLEEIAYRNRDKIILFATHHPFRSYGIHGGHFTLKQHIFPFTDANPSLYIPLPVIGSIYPIARGVFGNIQDIPHPAYREMIKSVEESLHEYPNVIHVAGHDHELQLIKDSSFYYIVSGAGAKESRVKEGSKSLFSSKSYGYTVLELQKDNFIHSTFYAVADSAASTELFAQTLLQLPPKETASTAAVAKTFPDSVYTNASAQYDKAGGLKRFLLGDNYRKEWNDSLNFKVFDINKEKGGLKILQRGGGHQTKSLRLEDKNGKQWALRSINKFPAEAIPEALRETFAKEIVQDQISAANPYAPLTIPVLADATGVPHANPVIVYVPDDPALGQYQKDFANTLCLFEEREPVPDKTKTYSTEKVILSLLEDNDDKVNQPAMLKARLLDILIADWDRHEDQWRWADEKSGKGKVYYPVPRDRDQAFFVNEGFISRSASKPWLLPYIQGFRENIPNVNGLAFSARYFDRFFLNEIDEAAWKKITETFVASLSDEILQEAVNKFPTKIYASSGEQTFKTLQARKNVLVNEALKYYRFISKAVDVRGTSKNEYFKVSGANDGKLHVIVYKISKEGDTSKVIYNRIFDPSVTKEVRLYGMESKDVFDIVGTEKSPIKIRMIGGKGKDEFNVQNDTRRSKNIIYDLITEENKLPANDLARLKTSADPAVNKYDYRAFHYNRTAPVFGGGYNPDDGILAGIGFSYTGYAFRKNPAVTHRLFASHSFRTKAFTVDYKGNFHEAVGKANFLINANIKSPANLYFFGFGNESLYNQTGPKNNILFYRTRFDLYQLQTLLEKNLTKSVSLTGGFTFQHFNMDADDNDKRIITSYPAGIDSATLYKSKSYGGLQAAITIDTRNNKLLPTRGLYWTNELNANKGFGKNSKDYLQFTSDLTLLTSFNIPASFVIATRIGGGVSTSDAEFFQALTLGNKNYLRGYRTDRFAGTARLYGNLELRMKLFDFQSYIFPGTVGLVAFNDIGRVWYKKENSDVWHYGYGGGIYFSPANLLLITATVGASKESVLPNFTVGFRF
jgi:hypothetical protein